MYPVSKVEVSSLGKDVLQESGLQKKFTMKNLRGTIKETVASINLPIHHKLNDQLQLLIQQNAA